MKKISQKEAYQNLALAVLQTAIEDLPRRFKWSKEAGEYQEFNFRDRVSALRFFETGRFHLWADMADIAHDVLIGLYAERNKVRLRQDRETKEWEPYEVAALQGV